MRELTPQVFAERRAGVALSERASYQQHFLDLCAMLGAPTPANADPKGEFYAFGNNPRAEPPAGRSAPRRRCRWAA
ncbi:MAG: hypothetical protein M3N18_01265 [Actinomycetota bacterium]|nr:hypothetical protein [Actinomycetota bacterium]